MPKAYGAVYEWLARQFHGAFRPIETSQTVGVSQVRQVGHNPERVSLTFVNLGATTIFIAPSTRAASSNGIRLIPNGGTVAMNLRDDGVLPALEWYAIGDGAGGTLYSLEVVRDVAFGEDEGVA